MEAAPGRLEEEIASRTAIIATIGAIVRALATLDEDEQSYRSVLKTILTQLRAEDGLFQYLDASRIPRIAFSTEGGGIPAQREDRLVLEEALRRGEGPFEHFGLSFRYTIARRLLSENGEEVGVVLFGREGHDFAPGAKELVDQVIVELAPLVAAREARVHQDRIRREAEDALRKSEARLRAFFEESHDMIYSANTEDVIASINASGLALLGCADRFEAVGRPFSNFVLNWEDRALFLKKIREANHVDDYEVILKRPDGTTVFCLESARAVRDRGGKTLEIQGIIKDISERINNEKELWRTNLELAEANQELKKTQMFVVQQEKLASIGQLAAGIAHEINNPLGFLKSNHSMLGRYSHQLREAWSAAVALHPGDLTSIAAQFDLDYIFTEIESLLAESDEGYLRIMDIVKNLRSFARSGAETAVTAYSLNKGLESTLVVAWNEIKYVAEVEKHLDELPDIEADGGGINQVILNLLVNAAQAIGGQKRQEKGRIILRSSVEGEGVALCVSDDGPGIPEANRLRVFDPFFTTKDPGKGTGLGLSISYDIVVNKHGGRISVGDAEEGGALFKIWLPLRRAAKAGATQGCKEG